MKISLRVRLWASIVGVAIFLLIGIGGISILNTQFGPQFSSDKRTIVMKGDERLIYFENHESSPQVPSALMKANGEIIKSDALMDNRTIRLYRTRIGLFLAEYDEQNETTSALYSLDNDLLVPMKMPSSSMQFIDHISPSPDDQYLLFSTVQGNGWYLLNRKTAEWSTDISALLPKELQAERTNEIGEQQASHYEYTVEWEAESEHRLFVRIVEMSDTLEQDIARFQYFPEEKQIKAFDLNADYGPLQSNPPQFDELLEFNPQGERVTPLEEKYACFAEGRDDSTFFTVFRDTVDCQNTTTVTVTNPLIGKQRVIVERNGQTQEVASWFSTWNHNRVRAQFLSDTKLLVTINDRIGVLDTETGELVHLLDAPRPMRDMSVYNVYTIQY